MAHPVPTAARHIKGAIVGQDATQVNHQGAPHLARQIKALYAQAETRTDVENIELQHHNNTYLTPFRRNGLQAHMPYAAYAHWLILHRILTGRASSGCRPAWTSTP